VDRLLSVWQSADRRKARLTDIILRTSLDRRRAARQARAVYSAQSTGSTRLGPVASWRAAHWPSCPRPTEPLPLRSPSSLTGCPDPGGIPPCERGPCGLSRHPLGSTLGQGRAGTRSGGCRSGRGRGGLAAPPPSKCSSPVCLGAPPRARHLHPPTLTGRAGPCLVSRGQWRR